MTTILKRRAWVAFVTFDALLLLGSGSAVAAPLAAPAISLHVPAVLMGGLGLLVTSLTGRSIRR